MDDLQFRRSIYADPKNLDDALQAALSQDPKKQQFAQEIDRLDDEILQALNVPVPDDLADKLLLKQSFASHRQQKRKTRWHLAIAASIAFAFGLTLNFMLFSNAYSNLSDHALAHVYYEEGYFDNNSQARVSLASLNDKMSDFNASFDSTLGELIAADYCRFNGLKVLHLVFQGNTNPVTVFVVPESDMKFTESFADEKYQGRAMEFSSRAVNGNIVVIGDENESIDQWQRNINDKVQWSI